MRIKINTYLIIIEILDEIYARAQNWSTVEHTSIITHVTAILLTGTVPGYEIKVLYAYNN